MSYRLKDYSRMEENSVRSGGGGIDLRGCEGRGLGYGGVRLVSLIGYLVRGGVVG